LSDKLPGTGELLDAMIRIVRNIDVTGGINGDPEWSAELAITGALRAEPQFHTKVF
jgi:hypothetical protein